MRRFPAWAQFLAAAVLAAVVVLAVIAVTGGGDDDTNETAVDVTEPTPSPTADVTPTATPEPTVEPTATPAPTTEPTEEPTPEPTPEPADETDTNVAAEGEVPESKAVVKGGQIFLEGAVPSEEAAEQIVAIAASNLGEENVINEYVIDPRADDPNLGNVRVDDTVLFETNSAVIAPEFEPLLNQALALMLSRPSVTVTVEGHTDDIGSQALNLDLSQRRAESVVTYLVDRGVERDRFTAIGKGEAEPIVPNDSDENRQLNRRIQFFLFNLLADG